MSLTETSSLSLPVIVRLRVWSDVYTIMLPRVRLRYYPSFCIILTTYLNFTKGIYWMLVSNYKPISSAFCNYSLVLRQDYLDV